MRNGKFSIRKSCFPISCIFLYFSRTHDSVTRKGAHGKRLRSSSVRYWWVANWQVIYECHSTPEIVWNSSIGKHSDCNMTAGNSTESVISTNSNQTPETDAFNEAKLPRTLLRCMPTSYRILSLFNWVEIKFQTLLIQLDIPVAQAVLDHYYYWSGVWHSLV